MRSEIANGFATVDEFCTALSKASRRIVSISLGRRALFFQCIKCRIARQIQHAHTIDLLVTSWNMADHSTLLLYI
ncbi:hypothetical protein DMH17_10045 [Raoultella planticola]|nr:hypothetical protein [Raoultella planticola]